MTRHWNAFLRLRGPWRAIAAAVAGLCLLGWIGMATYHAAKPLPEGVGVAMPLRSAEDTRFLADRTWVDSSGRRQTDHAIFDRVLTLIGGAERLIVLDMFLFNEFAGDTTENDLRGLSGEVTTALLAKRQARPDMPVILITDPMNTLYGGIKNDHLAALEAAGVDVIMTRLTALRDSNPAWSGLWRLCCQWFGNSPDSGWLPNPVGEQPLPLRSVLALLNFKANHRKTLVVDSAAGWTGLVTSGNPHDASSAHGNIAVEFTGPAALDLLATERAVARFSRPDLDWPEITGPAPASSPEATGDTRLQVLTEGAILERVEAMLAEAGPGDSLDLAMFYLAHRGIVTSLIDAHERGVTVRALLDPNRNAFGRAKDGIPNQPVAAELHRAGIPVRWCNTRGEQCHSKFVLYRSEKGPAEFIAGSANFTRRNLDDFNLETSVFVRADPESEVIRTAATWFEDRWENRSDRRYSLSYGDYGEGGWWEYWRYRFMEATGLSTF